MVTGLQFQKIDFQNLSNSILFTFQLPNGRYSSRDHHHHHHATLSARISLTFSRHVVHCFRHVLRATSRISIELLYVVLSWSSCLCSSIWKGPLEYVTYKLVPTSPAVSSMSGSSNLYSFCDGWQVALQLLLCGVLPSGFVHYCSQHSCVVAVKLFLHTFS